MNLIYVTSGFPYPLTSGYLRHFHFLERLARRHQIRLLSLVADDHVEADRAAIEALGVHVTTFDISSTATRRLTSRAARVAPSLVLGGVAELRRAVRGSAQWADAAIVSGKAVVGVLSALGDLPVLVDACDATSMRLESRLPERRGLDRAYAELELRGMRSIERRLSDRSDHMIVASRRDGDFFGWPPTTSVVANGIDTKYWMRQVASRPLDTVIFTGKMRYAPNADAAHRLIDSVWPAVRRRRPDARLLIVGTMPSARLVSADGCDGVTVTGKVDDMRRYLELATVFAAPIRHGAGIQNKVLEALAMELPVVASRNASDGLILDADPPPVLVTDDLDEMADIIVSELAAADLEPAPLSSNRTWVADRFDWDASAERLDEVLCQITRFPPLGTIS